MARVYYKKKKLIGNPIHSNAITPAVFENIMTKTAPPKNTHFTYNLQNELNTFEKALVWDGDFWYTHKNSEIYLPKAIIFGDDFSLAYPKEYFFIAYIEGKIELRKIKGGNGVTFKDTIGISKKVTDIDVIIKINNSMVTINEMASKIKKKSSKIKPKVLKPTDTKILKAYDRITELCGWSEKQRQILQKHIVSQKIGNDQYEVRNLILDYCYQKELELFIYRDWKDVVEEFTWELQKILKQNFGIDDPISLGKFNNETPIYEKGVFEHFNIILKKYHLELNGLETDGDDYQFIINKIENSKEIKQNLSCVGFETWRSL
ncbi:DUF6630 family protein [Aquimarina sediminis]|uniref:DUF6630 family protein n=1 Tax=Aquimarina sediminis TaxID=2070536 RepID=UPI000CA079DD|nr:hypothetical protein [Aquimarina sediminis]